MRYWVLLCLTSLSCFASADTRVNVVGLFTGQSGAGHQRRCSPYACGRADLAGRRQSCLRPTVARPCWKSRENASSWAWDKAQPVAGGTSVSVPGMTLYANKDGHFFGEGSINGRQFKFLLDTGATAVAMSSAEARRLGVDYVAGREGTSSTAGGMVRSLGRHPQ